MQDQQLAGLPCQDKTANSAPHAHQPGTRHYAAATRRPVREIILFPRQNFRAHVRADVAAGRQLLPPIHYAVCCAHEKKAQIFIMAQGEFRPMKYPYTLTAKIAQFPYKFYYKNSWLFKYYLFGILASVPIFYKIQKLSFAPDNVAKWDKTHREMFEGHH